MRCKSYFFQKSVLFVVLDYWTVLCYAYYNFYMKTSMEDDIGRMLLYKIYNTGE